ncbi:MAG: hypothetical protein ACYC97_13735 [Metallibacterium sp.]
MDNRVDRVPAPQLHLTAMQSGYASTTVTQSRVSIFAPSRRSQGVRTVHVANAWGDADVTGDLNQIHRSILDYLIGHAGWLRRRLRNGSLDVAFAPRELLRLLGHRHPGQSNVTWLETMFEDLRIARFRATVRGGAGGEINLTKNVGIVTEYADARTAAGEYLGYGVTISGPYMGYYEADLPCHTENLTAHISSIDSGAVQAIVHFLLSHSGGYTCAPGDLFAVLGIDGRGRRYRARRDLRAYAEHLADRFSVTVDLPAERIHYARRPEVWFGDRWE